METQVTYRLKGEAMVRTFTTAEPYNAMRNLLPDVDMMYAVGGYRSAVARQNCCYGKYCVQQQEFNDEMWAW